MPARILVVDDEPNVKRLFEQKFRSEVSSNSMHFLFAEDGRQALDILRLEQIDVVLSDINMPRMNGLELLRNIRHISPMSKTIMVTAYGDMKNIRHAMNDGAVDFITKPIDFSDLKATLSKTLSLVEEARERAVYKNEIIGAREILQQVFPKCDYEDENVHISGTSIPALLVGGDSFDFFPVDMQRTGIMISDVCGKGLPAALFMYFIHNMMRVVAENNRSAANVLQALNEYVFKYNHENNFITSLYCVMHGPELSISSAGHHPALLIRQAGNAIEEHKTPGLPLGILPDAVYTQSSITLESGDIVVLYTDGAVDALNEQGEAYGEERFAQLCLEHKALDVRSLLAALLDDIAAHQGNASSFDDTTIIVLKKK